MLDPRWRKVWRDAMGHKARTALVVLAIAIGLAGAGAILDTWALVRRVTHESYITSNPVSATLRTSDVEDSLLAAVRKVRGVRAARARRQVSASLRARGGWQPALLIAESDYTSRTIGALTPTAGAWPPTAGGVVVERSSVDFAGVTLNEPVDIAVGGGEPVSLAVTGIVRDVSVAPGWMEHVVYTFIDRATLARLGVAASYDEVQILVDPQLSQNDVRGIASDVERAIERSGRSVRDVDVPVPGEHIHAAQMNSLLLTHGAFGVLALLVCAFLVVNLIAATLAGQVREIGVMKTLGARRDQLTRMYLTYAAGLGLLASIIATPLAVRVGRSYAALKAELLNFDVTGQSVPWWAVAVQILVGVLVPVLAAALPVRRGCRASVAAALRDFGIDRDDGTSSDWSRKIGGLGRPMLLSIRNAFRKRQRMALTLLALATGGSVYLGAANLRQSVLGAVDLLFAPRKYDFSIGLAEPHAADSIERVVAAVPDVRAVEAWSVAKATLVRPDSTAGMSFGLNAMPARTLLFEPQVVAGRWIQPGDRNTLVVSRRIAQMDSQLALGRTVTLDVAGVRARWTVVGVVDEGPTPSAYTTRDIFSTVTGGRGASAVLVASSVSGVAAQVELIQRVRGALERSAVHAGTSQLLAESRRVMEDHLLMVVQFLSVMGWVMIAVGGMGLASTMGLAVLERTREIGVLRAIGARHRAIARLVQVEGLVIAVASWLCAIPLSIPMSAALAAAFSRVMIRVPVRWIPDGRGALTWLALVIVISVIACAWPAMRAMRVTIARALAYE